MSTPMLDMPPGEFLATCPMQVWVKCQDCGQRYCLKAYRHPPVSWNIYYSSEDADRWAWPPEGKKVLVQFWTKDDVAVAIRVGDKMEEVIDNYEWEMKEISAWAPYESPSE